METHTTTFTFHRITKLDVTSYNVSWKRHEKSHGLLSSQLISPLSILQKACLRHVPHGQILLIPKPDWLWEKKIRFTRKFSRICRSMSFSLSMQKWWEMSFKCTTFFLHLAYFENSKAFLHESVKVESNSTRNVCFYIY